MEREFDQTYILWSVSNAGNDPFLQNLTYILWSVSHAGYDPFFQDLSIQHSTISKKINTLLKYI